MSNSEIYQKIVQKGPFKRSVEKVLSYNSQKSSEQRQRQQDLTMCKYTP